jgi:hypothetical protein
MDDFGKLAGLTLVAVLWGCGTERGRSEGAASEPTAGVADAGSRSATVSGRRVHADAHGVRVNVATGSGLTALELPEVRYGCDQGADPGLSLPSAPRSSGATTQIDRTVALEGFEERALGVEHTLELREPPPCEGEPVVTWAIGGGFRGSPVPDANDALELIHDGDGIVLGYGGLSVFDRDGRAVPARFTTTGNELAVHLSAGTAPYPLTIDPLIWAAVATLLPPGGYSTTLGGAVATSGNVVAVSDRSNSMSGQALVYRSTGLGYSLEDTLAPIETADDPSSGFGQSLALEGTELFVGQAENGRPWGSVFIYRHDATGWRRSQRLLPAADVTGFGSTLGLSGSRAIVGVVSQVGNAFTYTKTNGSWVLDQELTCPALRPELQNSRVAIAGNVAAVTLGQQAYISERSSSGWSACALVPFAQNEAPWGTSVATNGTVVAFGRSGNEGLRGSVDIFQKSAGTWVQTQKLVPTGSRAGDGFGLTVAMEGNRLLVGAPGFGFNPRGLAYIFEATGGTFRQTLVLGPRWGANGDGFAAAVALSASTAVVGAPGVPYPAAHVYSYGLSRGSACRTSGECLSGYCVDGVCCSSACGSCGACSIAAGSDTDGICRAFTRGKTCRAARDACDAPELCDGGSAVCPADAIAARGAACRPAAGPCDEPEACDGTSSACPTNVLKSAGSVCRAARGACDAAEQCNGTTAACPADALRPQGGSCRPAAGDCDVAEVCDGRGADCPLDGFLAAETPCRAALGLCDVAEVCSGWTAACPSNVLVPAGTICRASDGACDAAEACDGSTAACPENALLPSGRECRAARGACDAPESCDGASSVCPADARRAAGTTCRSTAGDCDVEEQCDGDGDDCPLDAVKSTATPCREPAGVCDRSEVCDGVQPACPPDTLQPAGTPCRAVERDCDLAESCSGSSVECPADAVETEGTPCSTGSCRAGRCAKNPDVPPISTGGQPTSTGGAPAAAPASPVSTPNDSGCSCRTAGEQRSRREPAVAITLAMLALLVVRRMPARRALARS